MFLPAGSDVLILWSAGTGITTLATMRLNSTSRLDSGRLLTGRMIHRAIGGLHARKRTGEKTWSLDDRRWMRPVIAQRRGSSKRRRGSSKQSRSNRRGVGSKAPWHVDPACRWNRMEWADMASGCEISLALLIGRHANSPRAAG